MVSVQFLTDTISVQYCPSGHGRSREQPLLIWWTLVSHHIWWRWRARFDLGMVFKHLRDRQSCCTNQSVRSEFMYSTVGAPLRDCHIVSLKCFSGRSCGNKYKIIHAR